ncbi:hypothetical protein EVG20_g10270 [Dentipellis fragilis]|uniref:DUF6533 domain-containing protein n=1 Tax=Dentipellis fragilis TaxID=205917 RepID=A0A4Y9XS02_9AGAM|nr:hypothetical protein EVG20_g10270 [Dentipellis fragilis]
MSPCIATGNQARDAYKDESKASGWTMNMDLAAMETIVTALQQMRIVTMAPQRTAAFYWTDDLDNAVGSFTLLAYDYFLTLPDEVGVVWGSHWTITMPIFLLNRYVPFVNTGVAIYSGLGLDISDGTCHALYSTIASILVLRTWAIWGKDKMVGYGLGILLAMSCIAMSVVVVKFLKSMKFTPINHISPQLRGCLITDSDRLQYICYAISLGYESTILFLTLIKGVQHLKWPGSSVKTSKLRLIVSLYRDGVLAYLLIFVSSVANVLILLLGPSGYANILIVTQRVLHVVLTNCILLSIRRNVLAVSLVPTHPQAMELQDIQ